MSHHRTRSGECTVMQARVQAMIPHHPQSLRRSRMMSSTVHSVSAWLVFAVRRKVNKLLAKYRTLYTCILAQTVDTFIPILKKIFCELKTMTKLVYMCVFCEQVY